ncbi:dimethyladenosine transferase 1, mitochondrial [Neocloeon triangulifer]|uniref:dimethyladenosine transferase 1, mitochondrial n=1 Tax=Neocloeon triangulifer TaxID=2078957 RepID=UPI00286F0AF0|nr:dimethyladenosine transferase 1, mitochondrial [Neocloeon triangulifer]
MQTVQKVAAMRLPPLPTVRDLINLFGLRAKKQLSQNFLLDPRITDKIVRAAGGKKLRGAHVCEVGPGPGPITRSIFNAGIERLVVIEKDKRFLPTLEILASASGNRLDIHLGDVLSFNMSKMFPEELRAQDWAHKPPPINIIGNLPFSVSTPLIIRWLMDISERQNVWTYGRVPLTLTFQKEVAERIVALERDKQRCRLSLMSQAYCDVELKFLIKGSSFVPKPDVDVGVVHMVPKSVPSVAVPFKVFEKVTRTVFCMRQKYCIIPFKRLFPESLRHTLAGELLKKIHVDPTRRPFQLTMEEFSDMASIYWETCQKIEGLFEYNFRASVPDRNEPEWNSRVLENEILTG